MDAQAIMAAVNEIFIKVFDKEDLKLAPETSAKDIPEWDSLNHIHLVVAIEKRFEVRFATAEIRGWKNVGQMCGALEKRLAARPADGR